MKSNFKNLDFGSVAVSKAVVAPAPILPVHVQFLKAIEIPQVVIKNVKTLNCVGVQLGALGSGFQTQRGFGQLYGVDLGLLLEAFEKGENFVCDAFAMRSAMVSSVSNKGKFFINLMSSQKTLVETSTLEDGFFNIRFSFNLIYDDSIITGNPTAMCNMISRPLNMEISLAVDLEGLNKDLAELDKAEEEPKKVDVIVPTTEEVVVTVEPAPAPVPETK